MLGKILFTEWKLANTAVVSSIAAGIGAASATENLDLEHASADVNKYVSQLSIKIEQSEDVEPPFVQELAEQVKALEGKQVRRQLQKPISLNSSPI